MLICAHIQTLSTPALNNILTEISTSLKTTDIASSYNDDKNHCHRKNVTELAAQRYVTSGLIATSVYYVYRAEPLQSIEDEDDTVDDEAGSSSNITKIPVISLLLLLRLSLMNRRKHNTPIPIATIAAIPTITVIIATNSFLGLPGACWLTEKNAHLIGHLFHTRLLPLMVKFFPV